MFTSAERLWRPPSRHTKSIVATTSLAFALVLLTMACTRPNATEQLWAVGQTAEVDGWRVTVHSFSSLPADEWRQPADGQIFCALELTLENSSEQIRYVMPEKQMMLLGADGRNYAPDHDAAVIAARSRQWLAVEGEFGVAEKSHGAAAYQIPNESQGMRWVFRTSLFPWAPKVTFVLRELSQP
jgi:hypothetical protein